MLLRTTALALLLANGAYFAWSQGMLAPVGLAPASAREPQRMAQQIRPEALSVVPTGSAASAPSAAPAPESPLAAAATPSAATPPAEPLACLQAGPFDAAQADTLRKALAAAGLPAGAWTLEPVAAAAERWIVYMGRYTDADALEKKRVELRALRVETAPILQPSLAPGLSLGVFSTQEAANEHLAQLARRGVRTARVVAEQRESTAARLRLPAADAALRAQVLQLGPALAGRSMNPC